MKKVILIIFLSITSLNADIQDNLYTCITFQKESNNEIERLDMQESLAKGGYYSFSMEINFLRAEVSLNKSTIENIDYQPMRFAYRTDINDYLLYVYDYNKAHFIIDKGNRKKVRVTMTLENKDIYHYQCMMYKE